MKFVNTKRFSPVIHEKDLPWKEDLFYYPLQDIPKNQKDYEDFIDKNNIVIDTDWWDKQNERCLNGYTVPNAVVKGGDALVDEVDAHWNGKDVYLEQYDLLIKDGNVHISGRFYFFLNFWPIFGLSLDNRTTKSLVSPRFLMMQFLFFRRVELMFLLGKDSQELKGRQLGYSELGAGGIIGYNYTFFPHSVNVIVGGTQEDADHTMLNVIRGLDNLRNSQFYKKRTRSGDSKALIRAKYFGSEVRSLTAKDNAQTVSRFSPTMVWYEEIGKGKKDWSIKVAEFVKPSIEAENIRTGHQIFIGTGGEMELGAADLEKRHFHPEEYDVLSFKNTFEKEKEDVHESRVGHFTGKQWFKIIDKDGNPEIAKSIKAIEDSYKHKTFKQKYIAMTQEPIWASQAFFVTSGGFFGEDRVLLLNDRLSYINTHRKEQICEEGILEPIDKNNMLKGMKFVPQEGGWFLQVEKPELDHNEAVYQNLYCIGTDSYDMDADEGTDDSGLSRGCVTIRKRFLNADTTSNLYVAMILERPSIDEGGVAMFYQHSIMACIYYGMTQNNIEHSNLKIFQYYIDNGFEHLLKRRPILATANAVGTTNVKNRYGTDKSLKPTILSYLKDDLTDSFISQMYIPEQIKAFIKFRYIPGRDRYNCDITMASAEASIAVQEDKFITAKSKGEGVVKHKYARYVTVGGVKKKQYI